jgi:type III secretion protein W
MRIDNTGNTGLQPNAHNTPAAAKDLATGSWRGEAVQVSDKGCDILTDAAEEITFAHSERTESHKLEERDVENLPEVEIPDIDTIQRYLDAAAQHDADEKLREFVKALRQHEQRGDTSQGAHAREEAEQRFSNPTERFMALAFAAQEFTKEGGHEPMLAEIRQTIGELHDDFGGHIRADLNTIGIAAEFGQGDAASIASFQAGYRDAVLGVEGGLSGMLKGAMERFGEKDYARAVSAMIKALGSDLAASQGPSASSEHLRAVVQELYQMEVLSTVLENCQTLARRMDAQHGLKLDAGAVMQDLVSAAGERWSTGSRFGGIADRHGASETVPKILFLSGTKALLRDMPPKVFADADARFNTVKSVQEALDEAIAIEEES